jgi:hypothetical protein
MAPSLGSWVWRGVEAVMAYMCTCGLCTVFVLYDVEKMSIHLTAFLDNAVVLTYSV